LDADADAGQLPVADPGSGTTRGSIGIDAECARSPDGDVLQSAYVRGDPDSALAQPEQWPEDELSRPVKGQIAASIGIDNGRVQGTQDVLASAPSTLRVHGRMFQEQDDFRTLAPGDLLGAHALPGISGLVWDEPGTSALNDLGTLDASLFAFQSGPVRDC